MVNIFCFNIEKNTDCIHIPTLIRFISLNKQPRINAFRDLKDAQRVIIGDLLIRAIACRYLNIKNSELQFQTYEYGKPYLVGLDNFHYNLSHSGRWVVCAIDHEPVGIDIEQIVPIEFDIIQNYFSKEEIIYIKQKPVAERTASFYDIWTLKESYIKALGYGLSQNLNSFTLLINNEGKVAIKESNDQQPTFLRQYQLDEEYRLSLCAFKNEFPDEIQLVDTNWILNGIQK